MKFIFHGCEPQKLMFFIFSTTVAFVLLGRSTSCLFLSSGYVSRCEYEKHLSPPGCSTRPEPIGMECRFASSERLPRGSPLGFAGHLEKDRSIQPSFSNHSLQWNQVSYRNISELSGPRPDSEALAAVSARAASILLERGRDTRSCYCCQ